MNKISVENITHRFSLPGKRELTALEDIRLSIKSGEFIAVIGESGCGKSTLLNLIAGLMAPGSGEILVNGEAVTSPHSSRMMMFQEPCLLPWLTVEGNIAFGCNMRDEKAGLDEKVARLIRRIGLTGFEKVYPGGLSAGMRQRAALARSLISGPEILLMDESFSDVDFFTRATLIQLVLELWRELELTVILVTHDLEEALLLGQRIVLMGGRPGKIQQIFNVPLPFPRNIDDPELQKKKTMILERFNEHNQTPVY